VCGNHVQRGRGGAAGPGSSADNVLWGRRCEHRQGKGSIPDKEAMVGAHLTTMSTVRGGVEGDGAVVSEAVAELR
jgi:hypothetical protein